MRQPVDLRIARLVLLAVPVLMAAAALRELLGAVWRGSGSGCAASLHPACNAVATAGPSPVSLYNHVCTLLFSVVAWCFLYRLTRRH